MATPELTIEKVVEHHLAQNIGQKLTPHLIAGLVALMSQNLRHPSVITQAMGLNPATQEPVNA